MTEERTMYKVEGREVRRETRLPFADPRFVSPTPDEFRALLTTLGMTGSVAGLEVGVNGRTIRKWTGGEREIPYAAWRLLLLKGGLALEGNAAMIEARKVADRN